MTRFEHPFAKVCRAVLKEKYSNREATTPIKDIPENVMAEAMKRYNAGEKIVIHTPFYEESAQQWPIK